MVIKYRFGIATEALLGVTLALLKAYSSSVVSLVKKKIKNSYTVLR